VGYNVQLASSTCDLTKVTVNSWCTFAL